MKKLGSPRPQAVFGLKAKRAELLRFLDKLDSERHAVLRAVSDIDSALSLFTTSRFDMTRYENPSPGSQVEFRSFVREYLLSTKGPVSIGDTALSWMQHYGITPEYRNKRTARSRVRAYFYKLHDNGMLTVGGMQGDTRLWQVSEDIKRD
jgi:hypothetical protein